MTADVAAQKNFVAGLDAPRRQGSLGLDDADPAGGYTLGVDVPFRFPRYVEVVQDWSEVESADNTSGRIYPFSLDFG